jgi:hypothetical protein
VIALALDEVDATEVPRRRRRSSAVSSLPANPGERFVAHMEEWLSSMKGRVVSRGGSRSAPFWGRLMLVTVGFLGE